MPPPSYMGLNGTPGCIMRVLSVAASSNLRVALQLADTICAIRRLVLCPPALSISPFLQCSEPQSLGLERDSQSASPQGFALIRSPWRETLSQTLSLFPLRSAPHRSVTLPSGTNSQR